MPTLKRILHRLLRDESGFVESSELVLIGTILTIGAIAGLVTVRDTVATELGDLGTALKSSNQSYSYADVVTPCGTVSGSTYIDQSDFCTPGLSDDFPPTQLPPVVIGPGVALGGEGS